MRKILTIALISTLALFTACEGEVEDQLIGTWTVSTVDAMGLNITKENLDTYLSNIPGIDEAMKAEIEKYKEAKVRFDADHTCCATFGNDSLSGTYQVEGELITLSNSTGDSISLDLLTDTEPYEIKYNFNLTDYDSPEVDPIGDISIYFSKL